MEADPVYPAVSTGAAVIARLLVLATLLAGCASVAPSAPPATTVYLVRHAEKAATPPDDPPLTAQGAERATDLADMLAEAGVVAVYSSQYRRAHGTAAPLAQRLGLDVMVLEIAGPDVAATLRAQARQIAAENAGESSLVAGHSNTIPTMIAELTGQPMADIDERIYGDLFVVTIQPDGTARLERRRFGQPLD